MTSDCLHYQRLLYPYNTRRRTQLTTEHTPLHRFCVAKQPMTLYNRVGTIHYLQTSSLTPPCSKRPILDLLAAPPTARTAAPLESIVTAETRPHRHPSTCHDPFLSARPRNKAQPGFSQNLARIPRVHMPTPDVSIVSRPAYQPNPQTQIHIY